MTTNAVYESMKSKTPDGLNKIVLALLQQYATGQSNRVTKHGLVTEIQDMFENEGKKAPGYSTVERQIRNAVAELQIMGYPICSDSGEGGYWLALNYAEREAFIAEIESRANALIEKARKLRSADNIHFIQPEKATQLAYINGDDVRF